MDDDDCRETDKSEGEKMTGESHEIRIRLTKKLKRMLKYVGLPAFCLYYLSEVCFESSVVGFNADLDLAF
jgi:hypothetical protein